MRLSWNWNDAPELAAGGTYYAKSDAVRAAGRAPLRRGDPDYRAELDRDGDGRACESVR